MEVLISIFVLSMGLLGLAALLPVGSYTILETIKADRAGDCGRAALRDLKARRMLDSTFNVNSQCWVDPNMLSNGSFTLTSATCLSLASTAAPLSSRLSFVIDPWGVAGITNKYALGGGTAAWVAGSTLGQALPRLGLGYVQSGGASISGIAWNPALAEAGFRCPDDLTVTLPESISGQSFGRSRMMQNLVLANSAGQTTALRSTVANGSPPWSDGTYALAWDTSLSPPAWHITGGAAFGGTSPTPCGPYMNDPNNTGTVVSGAQGDYSWFLSVTRVYSPQTQSFDPTRARVSVVVCYKRDFGQPGAGLPAERAVKVFTAAPNSGFADMDPTSNIAMGGGSILLSAPLNDTPANQLGVRVREGDWVALFSTSNCLCSWYRVIAITDIYTDGTVKGLTQQLTLNGPDWQVTGQDYVIAIGQSVLGVYTTTVELDQDPAWQQ